MKRQFGGARTNEQAMSKDEDDEVEVEGREEDDDRGEDSSRKLRRNDYRFEEEDYWGRKQSGRKQRRNVGVGEESDDDGGRRLGRLKKNDGEEEEGETEQDVDEANADLTLQIVAKAEQRLRKKNLESAKAPGLGYGVEDAVNGTAISTRIADESGAQEETEEGDFVVGGRGGGGGDTSLGVQEEEEEGDVVKIGEPTSRSETPEEGELQEDADGNPVSALDLRKATAEEEEEEGRGKKRKKRKKREKKKQKQKGVVGDDSDQSRERGKDQSRGRGKDQSRGNSDKTVGVVEVKDGAAEESLVMRKLLRGPRYFDPPEEQGQSCYNCGKAHLAASCPDPRMRPCYICSGFGHEGRDCPQKTECYVCGKLGHISKYCPNKGSGRVSIRDGDSICLRCGHEGHDVSSCYRSYDEQDLEQVQCYVCEEFGHLCCVDIVDAFLLPFSCFNCGQMGHTGAGCSRRRRSDRELRGPPSVCFKCGEEGHYARSCSNRNAPWSPGWSPEGRPPAGNDKYLPRSAGRVPTRWMDIQQREPKWTASRRLNSGDRWTGSMDTGRASDSLGALNDDIDAYMGPIENFAASLKDGYRKRRKTWASTSAR